MVDDILNDYGRDTHQPQVASSSNGGKQMPKDLPYDPPKGPKNINDPKTPGLHGTNYGNNVNQGKH